MFLKVRSGAKVDTGTKKDLGAKVDSGTKQDLGAKVDSQEQLSGSKLDPGAKFQKHVSCFQKSDCIRFDPDTGILLRKSEVIKERRVGISLSLQTQLTLTTVICHKDISDCGNTIRTENFSDITAKLKSDCGKIFSAHIVNKHYRVTVRRRDRRSRKHHHHQSKLGARGVETIINTELEFRLF